MNITTIDALGRYFEALYTLNQRLLALCGTNAVDHMGIQEQYIDDVIMTLPRLIPYRFENNDIILVSKDGLLRFSDDIPLIRSEFEKLLQNHHDILVDIKRARNKLEHEMDNAHLVDSVTSPFATFSVTYIVSGEDKHICSDALISIVKDLNALFSKIQEMVKATVLLTQYEGHPYYKRLIRCDFADFNKIYESELLYIFGKAMLPF